MFYYMQNNYEKKDNYLHDKITCEFLRMFNGIDP